ncbi:OsmC family protein [Aquirhabdus parva]|uniref:OsmC family peroxiredoxin n=1 Tax=Aquirhabdus parva TaxID=2283318 RepID=A0A345P7A6_9GAMM|nr:OsmC family protein [Aquirhabdus parva]AXI03165.1 OsmC family peroxiredoxin [Aquirhabdus parva]
MAQYGVEVIWSRDNQNFLDNRYSRKHILRFDGGVDVVGSSSPHVVPLPYSETAAVDPEESFVAALSSCHMLWFLAIAAKRGFIIDHYYDAAIGIMAKNAENKLAMTVVTLKTDVHFSQEKIPSHQELDQMHHEAHEECFIANSVKTDVRVEPVYHSFKTC